MKALVPDICKIIEESSQAAVYRSELLCMMAMQDTKGISERMMMEIVDRWTKLAEEYRKNSDCGAGDEKLFADAESRGLPINDQIRAKMMRIEQNRWEAEMRGRRN